MHRLADNDPLSDSHYYLVSVTTGRAWHAATKSHIHIVLTGEMAETGVRSLDDGEHKVCSARISTEHAHPLNSSELNCCVIGYMSSCRVSVRAACSASSAAVRCTCC